MRISLHSTILILILGCTSKHENVKTPFRMSEEMLQRCEFKQAELQEVKDELRLFGKVAADNNKLSHIYPIAGGSVKKINVELGDYVKQGQVLAVVQSSEVADFQRQRLDALADLALAE